MCGITAAIGDINVKYFKRLCAEQDIRGGDAAGIWTTDGANIDVKGAANLSTLHRTVTEHEKSWLHFLYNVENTSSLGTLSENILENDVFGIAIAHARRTTRGVNIVNNIMPIVNYSGDFVFAHNGTVNNYANIARHFGVSYIPTKHSDSYVFSECLCHCNNKLEVLGYIHESSAFVWYDNHIGSESLNVFISDTASPKPLHYLQLPSAVYISSEARPLELLQFAHELSGGDAVKVCSFLPGHYYLVKKHEVILVHKVERKYLPIIKPNHPKKDAAVETLPALPLDLYTRFQNRVTIYNLKYWYNGVVCDTPIDKTTGKIIPMYIDHLGYANSKSGLPLYFYDGILVKGEAAIRHLSTLQHVDVKILSLWSVYPLPTPLQFGPNYSKSCFFVSNTSDPYTNGVYVPYGGSKTYHITLGKITKINTPTTVQEQTAAYAISTKYISDASANFHSVKTTGSSETAEKTSTLTEELVDFLLEYELTNDDFELYDDILRFFLSKFQDSEFYRGQIKALSKAHKARRQ